MTEGQAGLLEKMIAAGDEEQLTESIPGGWWLDTEKIDGRICWGLIRQVYISEISGLSSESYKMYYVNEWGRNALKKWKEENEQ